MPRIFMALQLEDRFPIVDILRQTPPVPETCQWATFLRNHDELTLEMVTDQDRDYMYRVYADDPTARLNLGIRRRLAPLLKSRQRIELVNGLLFSLPGTPVLYYGDEIGMGDNIYLADRDGVRTPMQWSADRNAGFSRANPQKLYLPVITDPEYHYEAINVEAQEISQHSLLWWTKRLIAMAKKNRVMGSGDHRVPPPGQPQDPGLPAQQGGRAGAGGGQPQPPPAIRGARSGGPRGTGPHRDLQQRPFPHHRPPPLPAHAVALHLLLAPSRGAPADGRHASGSGPPASR